MNTAIPVFEFIAQAVGGFAIGYFGAMLIFKIVKFYQDK